MTKIDFPFSTPALRVDQRLGTFFVAVLPADLLLQVAASDSTRATLNADGLGYTLEGTQRLIQDKRLTEIADYINRTDAAFPNSIILAANYNYETGFDQDEQDELDEEDDAGAPDQPAHSWQIVEKDGGCHTLVIPSAEKLAAVIDGQHRLFSFAKASREARESMNLLCSVYLDLPKALQAQIFAVINSTQKRVDKSLTYELFGYNVSDEPEEYWTPDKLAVFLTRKLGTDKESPLVGRILVTPKRDPGLLKLNERADWRVSTAVVVDGILRLFSSNPKRDSNAMRRTEPRPRSVLRSGPKDRSPLRDVFIEGNDALLYTLVLNYLVACEDVFWGHAAQDSFIFRTIGVQAVFDILRKIAAGAVADKDVSVEYFSKKIASARAINFADERFKNPSGSGRTYIRKTIEEAIGMAIA